MINRYIKKTPFAQMQRDGMARGTTLLACLTQTALSVITGVPRLRLLVSDSISKVRFATSVSLGSHQSLGRFVD